MAGFTTVPNVLGIIGGSPIIKAGKTMVENLKVAKSVDGGDLGSMLSGVMKDGLGSVFQNPIGNISHAVNEAASQASSQLQSFFPPDENGFPNPVATLFSTTFGTLQSYVTSIAGAAGSLSGVTPGDGMGFLNVISHAGMTSMLGEHLPAGLGLDTVLGPINASEFLEEVLASVQAIPARVMSGELQVAEAVNIINGHAYDLKQTTDLSNAAQAAVQNVSIALAMVSAAGASIHSTDPNILAILPKIVQPAALDAMKQAAADMIDPEK